MITQPRHFYAQLTQGETVLLFRFNSFIDRLNWVNESNVRKVLSTRHLTVRRLRTLDLTDDEWAGGVPVLPNYLRLKRKEG